MPVQGKGVEDVEGGSEAAEEGDGDEEVSGGLEAVGLGCPRDGQA